MSTLESRTWCTQPAGTLLARVRFSPGSSSFSKPNPAADSLSFFLRQSLCCVFRRGCNQRRESHEFECASAIDTALFAESVPGVVTSTQAYLSLEEVANAFKKSRDSVVLEGTLTPGTSDSAPAQTLEVSVYLSGLGALAAAKALRAAQEPAAFGDAFWQGDSSNHASSSVPVSFLLRVDVFASAPPLLFAKLKPVPPDSREASPPRHSSQGAPQQPAGVMTSEILSSYDGASVCSWLSGFALNAAPHVYSASLLLPLLLSVTPVDEVAESLQSSVEPRAESQRAGRTNEEGDDDLTQAKVSSEERLRLQVARLLKEKLMEQERRERVADEAPRRPGEILLLSPVRLFLSKDAKTGGANDLPGVSAQTLNLALTLPSLPRGEQGNPDQTEDPLLTAVDRSFASAAADDSTPQKVLLLVSVHLTPEPEDSGFSAVREIGEAEAESRGNSTSLSGKASAVEPACVQLSVNPLLLKNANAREVAALAAGGLPAANEVYVDGTRGASEEDSEEATTVDVTLAPGEDGISLIHLSLESMQTRSDPSPRSSLLSGRDDKTEDFGKKEEKNAAARKAQSRGDGLLFVELDDASPEESPQVLICQKPRKTCTEISSFHPAPSLTQGTLPDAYRAPLLLYQEERERSLSPFFFFPYLRRHLLLPLLLLPSGREAGASLEGEGEAENGMRGRSPSRRGLSVSVLLLFPSSIKGKTWNFRFGVLHPQRVTVGAKDTPSPASLLSPLLPSNTARRSSSSSLSSSPSSSPSSYPSSSSSSPSSTPSSSPSAPSFLWLFLLLFISSAAMLTAIKLVLYMDAARLSRPTSFLPSVFPVDLEGPVSASRSAVGASSAAGGRWRGLSSPTRGLEAAEQRGAFPSFALVEKQFCSPAALPPGETRLPLLPREEDDDALHRGDCVESGDSLERGDSVVGGDSSAWGSTAERRDPFCRGDDLVRLPSWEKKSIPRKGWSPLSLELQETSKKSSRLLPRMCRTSGTACGQAALQASVNAFLEFPAKQLPPRREGSWETPVWTACPADEVQKREEKPEEEFPFGGESSFFRAEETGRGEFPFHGERDQPSLLFEGEKDGRRGAVLNEPALFNSFFPNVEDGEKDAAEKTVETTCTATSREKDATCHSGDEQSEFPCFPDLAPSSVAALGSPFRSACDARGGTAFFPFLEERRGCFPVSGGSIEKAQETQSCASPQWVLPRKEKPAREKVDASLSELRASLSRATAAVGAGDGARRQRRTNSADETERGSRGRREEASTQTGTAEREEMRQQWAEEKTSVRANARGDHRDLQNSEQEDVWKGEKEEDPWIRERGERREGGDEDDFCRNWRRIVDPLGETESSYEVTYRGDSALVEVATTTGGDGEEDGRKESVFFKYCQEQFQ
ncbi:hypothetical protein TGVAND_282130 [Toxoplasma gondii VAND]|uniref:Uncharacterized protein n=1 Tax=Toxoplasma gondii VAND TaxID=933077 RepID=A0A086PIQ4_TOXGO|nr:hypothetical protein TGVAND_282130 [Toxoplasma gondii VAND]